MPLISYNKKNKCGPLLSSACVNWEGGYSGVLNSDNTACDASIEDVALTLSDEIKDVKDSLDLSQFNPHDLPFNILTQKIKDLLQQISDAIDDLNQASASLQSQVDDVKAGNIDLEIDLQCLSSEISNCETPPTYSLKSILELLISQNC